MRGDVNLDGSVDISDFNTLATNYDPWNNLPENHWAEGNFDGDTDVDIRDFNALIKNFSPLGYANLPAVQASAVTTKAVTYTRNARDSATSLIRSVVSSDALPTSEIDFVERAFSDWDNTNDDLVLPWENMANRRRLNPGKS